MSDAAYVHSRDAIEAFRVALIKFSEACRDALDELGAEVRRVTEWIEHDRPTYWKAQIRGVERAVHDAKQALERCLIFRVADERPACQEERVALRREEERLSRARERAENARRWRGQLQSEQFEMAGRLGQVDRLIEWSVPQAIAALEQILDRLESYEATR
jgi:lysyl-tRNA synthetase class I